jgi:hypothetical protein
VKAERFFLHDGRLWLGSNFPGWRRVALRLEPRGVVVVTSEARAMLHEWRHHDGALNGPEGWFVAEGYGQQRDTALVTEQWRYRVCGPADDTVFALIEYLAVCPEARPGLAEPTLLARLTKAMSSWDPPRPVPKAPLPFTERYDIQRALHSIIDEAVIVIQGRPVGGQPLPDFDALTWAAKPHLDPGVFHDHILEEARRMLSATPWPFEALLSPPA